VTRTRLAKNEKGIKRKMKTPLKRKLSKYLEEKFIDMLETEASGITTRFSL
jgi:hypothetical protein